MSNEEEVMTDIYNTLMQIRYPAITMAEPQNVELTILTGQNRISFLSWLLSEISPEIAIVLEKLRGTALEDELLKQYSAIGICTEKDLLMGNRSLTEQLPTLRLLLEFMKNVHLESSDITHETEVSIDSILQFYVNEDSITPVTLHQSKLEGNNLNAGKYFEDTKKDMIEPNKRNVNSYPKDNVDIGEKDNTQDDNGEPTKCDLTFREEKNRFVKTFSTIGSWPMSSINHAETTAYSMNDIEKIYSDFSALKEFLQAREEVSKTVIPKEVNKFTTSLNNIIEDTVILTQEIRNMDIEY